MIRRTTSLAGAALIAALIGTHAYALTGTNLCAGVRTDEVKALIGEAPGPPNASGPVADDDHPDAIATSCRFAGKDRIFALMLLDFKSVSDASAALQHDIATVKGSGDAKVELAESLGLGEEVYLAHEANSATYIARQGPRLIAIGVAGLIDGVPSLDARLLKLAQIALGRLPPPTLKPEPSQN